MKIKELREKTDAELARMLTESRNSLRDFRFKDASRQLKGVRAMRLAKKTVARIMTLSTERQKK